MKIVLALALFTAEMFAWLAIMFAAVRTELAPGGCWLLLCQRVAHFEITDPCYINFKFPLLGQTGDPAIGVMNPLHWRRLEGRQRLISFGYRVKRRVF